jgi:hypothetical protein
VDSRRSFVRDADGSPTVLRREHQRYVPPAARDLLTRLLDRNAEKRLGAKGAAEIKAHYFFHSIDWRKLLERKYEPSFKPNVVCIASSVVFCTITNSR